MLYFDHSASTPPYDEVIQTLYEVMKKHYANPSSMHKLGVEANQLIERSRALIAKLFGTSGGKWLFTSGGTESNNIALKGAAYHYRNRGNHIITTSIEHPSVFETVRRLEQEGFEVTYLPVSAGGHITADQVQEAITERTILVSVMHVNNEVGAVQPIEQIGQLLRQYPKILFHVDAVQSIGKLDIWPEEYGIDLLSGSAHKLRGPKGVGLLYVRCGVQLAPLRTGGSQEEGLAAGTENVPAIVATAKAVRLTMESRKENASLYRKLSSRLRDGIAEIPELKLNGEQPLAPHIVHFSYPGMRPEVMIHMLEQHQIMASTKSACSSKEEKPSRILLAMGAEAGAAASGVRISFGDEHTEADVDTLLSALRLTVSNLSHLERSNR
ncbi:MULTISPECIES: cysteine desulfurase family protein [unclassified Paenibacillus]|uniref:cysteine desulfurase family protein n=1 Tax=unclassified Paenibacillus TaxID=185978 RepID=UPI002F3FE800